MIGVDCVAGLEGDLLLRSGRGHGKVSAGSSGDIHRRGCVGVGVWEESVVDGPGTGVSGNLCL